MPHERFGHPCAALRAGRHVVLHGQTNAAASDAAGQAEQAMQSIATLLAQAGGALADIRKLTTTVTDRAWLAPVAVVIARHLGDLAPARTDLIVAGLGATETLVAIDADAIIP